MCGQYTNSKGGAGTCAASSAAFLANAFLACSNQNERQNFKAWQRANPHPGFGGSERAEEIPVASMGASNAHLNGVRAIGLECR
jgi:hypothetical protein